MDKYKKQPIPTVLSGGMKKGAVGTPINKMGVKVSDTRPQDADLPYQHNPLYTIPHTHMIMTNDGVKHIEYRMPSDNEIAVIDWVNFTIGLESLGDHLWQEDEFILESHRCTAAMDILDPILDDIFGFSTTHCRNSGLNFYNQSYVLGEDFGFVCIGGQRNTILIMINGRGCNFAKSGWELRLYNFLVTQAKRAKLTRVDIAHDDFQGKHVSVDWGNMQDGLGGFQLGNRAPNIEHKGNWRRPNGKGRTLCIGSRDSGKYLRIYEKGRAEGDPDDNWQRAEVEFKSIDRILPFDMLLAPSEYFIAAYPCFRDLAEHIQPERIETITKTAQINFQTAIENLKHQYGKYINVFKDVFEPEELINLICCSDPLAFPKRLDHVLITARRM
ncbi:replication initiation factor domain-containing protein [Acinetobacter haemolyticus]|uniref:replication initiation factor domain-containing protein n=1 Tax=Acinetobacter haemolyticus TaxID=29430 RepID=UPI0021CDB870|nr:replication initiation factor domain-containing protein [Acinetobacter haemolyticus]MCU4379973.1 replication initiation factor domain-containing protein [Acinetobacter haemolyticus]MCU4379982.1 replication initiation factor domain-containing protein [Acinetobacter haemolyticus]